MEIILLTIGKTDDKYLNEGITKYLKRLNRFVKFSLKVIPDLKNRKNLSFDQQKENEGIELLKNFSENDTIILLDENGKEFSSVKFSKFIEYQQLNSIKRLIFVVGGPYGFSETIYKRSNLRISLSAMTFSHQMVRLIFVEQLYRAYSIINKLPYHHQ